MREIEEIKKIAKNHKLNYEKVLENIICLMSCYDFTQVFELVKEQITEGKWDYLKA